MREHKLRLGIGIKDKLPVYLIDKDAIGVEQSRDLPRHLFGVPTREREIKAMDLYVE